MGGQPVTKHEFLKTTQEEDEIIVIEDNGKNEAKQSCLLVGKIITKKPIEMEIVAKYMQQIWKPFGLMTTVEKPENTMIFKFSNHLNRSRVLSYSPWHFDKHLMVLQELDQEFQENNLGDMNLHECEFWVQIWDVPGTYLTKNTGENLGKGIGRVGKIDVDSEGNIREKFIRIRVGINVDKPLKRIIKAVMGGKEVTLNLKYEKLPDFCYACGKMDHVLSECETALQYGPWLRAQDFRREITEGNADQKDVVLGKRLTREHEEEELKKKRKAEAYPYIVIKVARDKDLVQQIGKDVYFDLVDFDKVRSFRVHKQMPFRCFKDEVAKKFGVPVQLQRFWLWAIRQNCTYRPHRRTTYHEENLRVGQFVEVPKDGNNTELKMFLEMELGLDSLPVIPPPMIKDDILLFFKLYDPCKEELSYVGRLFVKASGKPIEILAKLNEMVGYAPNEEIDLYEEIKFEPELVCEAVDKKSTFRISELQDGDIICFQKSLSAETRQQFCYPDVPSFLEYIHTRQVR